MEPHKGLFQSLRLSQSLWLLSYFIQYGYYGFFSHYDYHNHCSSSAISSSAPASSVPSALVMAILAMDVPHEVMRPSLGWVGSFLSAGARICLVRPLFSGLFRLVSPGVKTAQSHICIYSYPIDPIGLFEDAVASTKYCQLLDKKVFFSSRQGIGTLQGV